MTPEAQRIAIAEACGWRVAFLPVAVNRFHLMSQDGRTVSCWDNEDGPKDLASFTTLLPDYLNDLNAMHEAEKVLTPDQRWHYVKYLLSVLGGGNWDHYSDLPIKAITATAAQRAEAFRRTIGKREDDK